MALDVAAQFEKKIVITGRQGGATGQEFTDYLMGWIDNPSLESKWKGYAGAGK